MFDEVITNHGNCYDTAIGIFTVPFSGTYLFIVNVKNLATNVAYVGLTGTKSVCETNVGKFLDQQISAGELTEYMHLRTQEDHHLIFAE